MSKAFSGSLNVAVGGPQGIGKTSVLKLVSHQHPELEVIFFGEQLPEVFAELPQSEKERIRTDVAIRIKSRLARYYSVKVVDLHYLDLGEPNPRIQSADFLSMFDLLLFLTAPPQVILRRRMADTTRRHRPRELAYVKRDVEAHLEYHDALVNDGWNAALIDCRLQPQDIAERLLRRIAKG